MIQLWAMFMLISVGLCALIVISTQSLMLLIGGRAAESLPYVRGFTRTGCVTAVVTFHDSLTIDQVRDRKDMSVSCHDAIDTRVEELRLGYGRLGVAI
jgi:hypothetical protein